MLSFLCRQRVFEIVSSILVLAGVCLPCAVLAQAGNYDHTVTITSPADAAARRSQLIQYIWGTSSLPAGLPSRVVINDNSPAPGLQQLARADTLEITMALGEKGYAHHLTPKQPNNKLIIYSEGHDDNFTSQHDVQLIDEILRNGYSVLLVYMPHMTYFTSNQLGLIQDTIYRGNPNNLLNHDQMVANLSPPSGSVLQFFLEPVAVSLNYLRQRWQNDGFPKYTDFGMAGLSGGGWATTVYAAIDPSIRVSVPVAGSMPRYLRPPSASGDAEQLVPGFYSIAGYLDLYLLGSYETGRSQVQVLNRRDSCCFGEDPLQFYTANVTPATSWSQAIRAYEREVRDSWPVAGGFFRVEIDESATTHEVSLNAVVQRIVGEMSGSRRSSGVGPGPNAFIRGLSGQMFHYGPTGWSNTGISYIGVPAVAVNSVHDIDVIYRSPDSRLMHAYFQNGIWSVPIDINGIVSTDPVVSWTPTGFDVFVLGRSYGVWHYWWNGSGVQWQLISATDLGIGAPTVVRTTGDRLNVFVRSHPSNSSYAANTLLYMMSIGGTNSWTVSGVGQQTITDFPSAVVDGLGEARVYARSETGQLLEAQFQSAGWNWSTISTVGQPQIVGSPSASLQSNGEVHVFARLTTNHLGVFARRGSWDFTEVTGTTLSLSPTSFANGTFARGSVTSLLLFNGSTWTNLGGYND